MQFQKATKTQSRLRMALTGPAGSGKTFTSLRFAEALAGDKGIAVIDTEHGSASKYADLFNFDVVALESFRPEAAIELIHMAEGQYGVLVVDSLSHFWAGTGGILEMHDAEVAKQQIKNSFTAWKVPSAAHQKLIEAILQSDIHIIATMRSKMEHVVEKDDRGKTQIRKVGLAPVQRQGTEYEFDIVADLDYEHTMVISKSRCFAVADTVITRPDGKFMEPVVEWLTSGEPATKKKAPQPKAKVETPPGNGDGVKAKKQSAKLALANWAIRELGYDADGISNELGAAGLLPYVQDKDAECRAALMRMAPNRRPQQEGADGGVSYERGVDDLNAEAAEETIQDEIPF